MDGSPDRLGILPTADGLSLQLLYGLLSSCSHFLTSCLTDLCRGLCRILLPALCAAAVYVPEPALAEGARPIARRRLYGRANVHVRGRRAHFAHVVPHCAEVCLKMLIKPIPSFTGRMASLDMATSAYQGPSSRRHHP